MLMLQRYELSALLTGFMATLSGLGLARFAYTALMPQMVLAGWFSGEQVAYLGAANLLGYLIGALAAAPLAERLGAQHVLRWSWIAVALSFAACSWPLSLTWFFVWRGVSGIAGAILMVLGPSVAMSAIIVRRRAVLGPLMFCGVGAGALLSATLIPTLARLSLGAVWWVLAAVCVWAAWGGWRHASRLSFQMPAATPTEAKASLPGACWTFSVVLVMLAYMADAFGFVPHTVFWVDYLVREQKVSDVYASTQWAIFGIGAIIGPLVAAFCATRWGWWGTTTGAYAIKTVAIAMPLFWGTFMGHAASSFLVGALSPGVAAITSGYLMQLAGPAQHKRMWGYATALFALMQAASGYFMAWSYASLGAYHHLFMIGGGALLLGTLMVAASRTGQAKPARVS